MATKPKLTADELYKKLDELGIPFEVVEVFEGLRVINVEVEEENEDED